MLLGCRLRRGEARLIESLKLFCDIVEARSISAAAERNYLSQSAVSQQVKVMEQEFGQRLLERSPKGTVPTEAGMVLYRGARDITERFRTLQQEVQDLSRAAGGSIRVATIYSVGLHDLPPFIRRFIQLYPNARVQLEYDRANRIYELVRQDLVDLGIVTHPQEQRNIGIIPLPPDEMVLVGPPGDPTLQSSDQPAPLALLDGRSMVTFSIGTPTRMALDKLFRDRSIHPNLVMEFHNVETIKRSVEAKIGLALLPASAVQNEVRSGTLHSRPIEGGLVRPVGALYRKGKVFSTSLKYFVDLLQNPRSSVESEAGWTPPLGG